MPQRVFHRLESALGGSPAVLLGPAPEQYHRPDLVLGAFAMLERQVEEGSAIERRAQIEPAVHGSTGGGTRTCIAGKGSQRAAVDVARKLVEQQHEGQRA